MVGGSLDGFVSLTPLTVPQGHALARAIGAKRAVSGDCFPPLVPFDPLDLDPGESTKLSYRV